MNGIIKNIYNYFLNLIHIYFVDKEDITDDYVNLFNIKKMNETYNIDIEKLYISLETFNKDLIDKEVSIILKCLIKELKYEEKLYEFTNYKTIEINKQIEFIEKKNKLDTLIKGFTVLKNIELENNYSIKSLYKSYNT